MPANVESSIESVAEYIAQREPDPFLRVKALHDYVVDRVAYDVESYRAGLYPPQDAETVFKTHKAVCAGYAKLLAALGQAVGENIVYVVGDSRSEASDLSGEGHAWNAAQIQGNWYLIDATWDSGYINESGFTKQYDTSYLFPPPQVMSISHFPDDPTWQLLAQPLSRGEFLRQPMLRPHFFAEGLTLVSPTRSQTDVGLNAIIQLKNPTQRWIMTQAVSETGESFDCAETTQQTPISCVLPSRGTYEVKLFTNNERYGRFDYVGALEFNRK
jgi:transglutaminase/protease-like cytokinesis protein 3